MASKPQLPNDFWQALADVRPYGHELTIAEVKCWFDGIWPNYMARGYKKHRRAISSWWGRVYEDEIVKAQERCLALEDRTTVRRMEQRLPSRRAAKKSIGEIPDFLSRVEENHVPDL